MKNASNTEIVSEFTPLLIPKIYLTEFDDKYGSNSVPKFSN